VDAFTGLLDGPRARQAFLLRLILDQPWSIWVDDRAPLSLVIILRGEAWLAPPDHEPVHLGAGDIAVVRGPEPYAFSFPLGIPPQVIALPGGQCTSPKGENVVDSLTRGVRTLGNSTTGETEALVGSYEHVSELGRRLTSALPRLAVVPVSELDSSVASLLQDEIVKDHPGQQVVLDRLLDLLVVTVLRAWFARNEGDAPGWMRANADPVVGPALRLLEENPAHGWTVSSLAGEVGCSRATLARRFTELVGEPPMTYLTERRLSLAADLLSDPDLTIGAIAAQVGYGTPFALSNAFKRMYGRSPRQYQTRSA
jgi:AraC-like DNA-binding protein